MRLEPIPTRRAFIGGAAALCGNRVDAAFSLRVFTPEQFGAAGDGRTNDSAAMERLSTAVNRAGGGRVVFRRTSYLVGEQRVQQLGQYRFSPAGLLAFEGCALPLHVEGNGARLICAAGLRYGVFGSDGLPSHPPMPFFGGGLATPYLAMVSVERCTGDVRISDLDLDGRADRLIVGGQYGDTGWQIAASGLVLRDNRGAEVIERVRASGHPQDGLMIDGLDIDTPGVRRLLTDVLADGNGRQGCSMVGGRGYRFVRCSFTRTGRGRVSSAPGAGVDIEAEAGKHIRDLVFSDCRFADNAGCGMVADSGDSARVRFDRCSFIGTTNWSAWPAKPLYRFEGCSFVGALTHAFGDPDAVRATQFVQCLFTDDPARSPTGKAYGGVNSDHPIADLSDARNMLFDRCSFRAFHGALPWSIAAIYRNCTMIQTSRAPGYPRGQYEGANSITGKVDLYSSRIAGTLLLNGQRVR